MHIKTNTSLTVFSLQEAFISLFPYLLVRAACTVLVVLNRHYEFINHAPLLSNVRIIYDIFPLLLCISISVQLSKTFQLSKLHFVLFSLFGFLILSGFIKIQNGNLIISANTSIVGSIFIPLINCYIAKNMGYLNPVFKPLISGRIALVNTSFNYIFVYSIVIFIALLIEEKYRQFPSFFSLVFSEFMLEFQAILHLLISHLAWLLGIHGTTTYRYVFDMSFYTQPIFDNLPYEQFFSVFVIFGGAGSTISLIIAILLTSKDKHSRLVAKSSIPFSIFNINEVIIYGLPIALNRNYIIPFLIVPLLNFILSYAFIMAGFIAFSSEVIPWTTPPILSGYLLTNSLLGSAWQVVLIMLGAFIYLPFTKIPSNQAARLNMLRDKLSNSDNLNLENKQFNDFERYQNISTENLEIDQDIKRVINGELSVFYQPQINIADNTIYGYEALIRLIKNDQVYPPFFLPSIEKAGLEEPLDQWVFKQVRKDIDVWKEANGENPLISINVYPKTLLIKNNIDLIINTFAGYKIKIEILEKSFSDNFEEINNALGLLEAAGFEISVDDFGSGYANLSLLGIINASSIKIDRELLLHCDTDKGKMVFTSSCSTFKEMEFHIISEGVETPEQLQFVKECGADVVQGFYYSKALSLDSAIKYLPTSDEDVSNKKI